MTTDPSDISFCCQYWDWLRGQRPDEPAPSDHGLDEDSARVLKAQMAIEFKAKKQP